MVSVEAWILDKRSLILSSVWKLRKIGAIRESDMDDAEQDGWLAIMEALQYVNFSMTNRQICVYLKEFVYNRLINKWVRKPLAKKRIVPKHNPEIFVPSFVNMVIDKLTVNKIMKDNPALSGNTRQSRNQALNRLIKKGTYDSVY